MAATNYTVFRAKHVQSIQFGGTAWSTTDWSSTTTAIDTSFDTKNGTILLDLVGTRDTNSPVKSEAFAKDITLSGNERSTSKDDLLGADSYDSQNQEVGTEAPSLLQVTCTLIYRNNMPFSIFNDSTKCCLMEMDNSEGTTSGIVNFGFNNIVVLKVGDLTRNSDGLMQQTLTFSLKGGTTGGAIAVSQTTPAETWSKIIGGDYAEEVRLS